MLRFGLVLDCVGFSSVECYPSLSLQCHWIIGCLHRNSEKVSRGEKMNYIKLLN